MPKRRVPRARGARRHRRLRSRLAAGRRKRSFLRARRLTLTRRLFRTLRRRAKRRRR